MKRLLMVTCAFIAFQKSPAQFESTVTDSRATAMGGAFVSLSDNSSAVFYNSAGLGQLKHRHISLFYEPSAFGLKEISTAAATYAEAFEFGTFGLGIRTFGFELYRESKISLCYGSSQMSSIHWGLGIELYNLTISGYGSAFAAGVNAGVIANLSDNISWGAMARNISGAKIGKSEHKISRSYLTGLRFIPSGNTNVLLDIEKEVNFPVSVKFGAEVIPFKNFCLRAGISTEPVSYSAGIGFSYEMFGLDYSITVTEPLGMTNRINVNLNFRD